jgi:reductive dehalogenase
VVASSLIVLGLVVLSGWVAWGLLSLREGERRAARVAFGATAATALPFFLFALLPSQTQIPILGAIMALVVVGSVLFLLPVGRAERGNDVPTRRFDERDILFARARLTPGSSNYQAYYAMRPQNKAGDDKSRSLPGLLSPDAREANALIFAATEASFGLTGALREAVDGPLAPERVEHPPALMSTYVKALARYYGAHTVGIAELKDYHVYSHVGRGSGEYGAPITLEHRYAIAFSVEMDHGMVGTAPAAPTVLESARQYVEAAKIALQLSNLMRWLGYPARAHIDGNYRVIAPLVARDAGLGEIGRMGLLMTPTLGPRVRLGVVTTDLPLIPDRRDDDTSVLDFCRVCKKCAAVCPVRAIPGDDRQDIDGVLRWRINSELCFRYWCVTGTDCGRCIALCPYSHPNNVMHNLVRRTVRRSGVARRAVLWLDDVFYGATPPPKPSPAWVPPQADRHSSGNT